MWQSSRYRHLWFTWSDLWESDGKEIFEGNEKLLEIWWKSPLNTPSLLEGSELFWEVFWQLTWVWAMLVVNDPIVLFYKIIFISWPFPSPATPLPPFAHIQETNEYAFKLCCTYLRGLSNPPSQNWGTSSSSSTTFDSPPEYKSFGLILHNQVEN